ncbi:hypothetical protein CFOL_v3_14982 [Cephalotus follicularis]|uniref:Gag-asp_proteas domain-containing protein n=1 Tax=Cephalotus follicularis TaxID=3775 RepID=A0A1Q3BUD5_CEPFO|nr:hypothetical protein CFOL_v3_14982 [Cephalotus follicularis]
MCHNRSLYLEAVINGVTFKRTLVDSDASINLMPYDTFKVIGIPERRLVKQYLDMSGFGAATLQTFGHVSMNLQVIKIRWPMIFQVIDVPTTYRVLLGRSWISENEVIPSTLYRCIKERWRGQDVLVLMASQPFTYVQAHMIEAKFFDLFAKDEDNSLQISSYCHEGTVSTKTYSVLMKSKNAPKHQMPQDFRK